MRRFPDNISALLLTVVAANGTYNSIGAWLEIWSDTANLVKLGSTGGPGACEESLVNPFRFISPDTIAVDGVCGPCCCGLNLYTPDFDPLCVLGVDVF